MLKGLVAYDHSTQQLSQTKEAFRGKYKINRQNTVNHSHVAQT